MRWVAAYEPGEGGTWRARVETYMGVHQVRRLTCPHRHRSQAAAVNCARSMVDKEAPERVIL